ncbi:tRNA(Ile)-lysidine synthetase [Gloeomargarita lithophora Alchichica-D10]|uniref:tRNA(Ile)-lysidine synthase n=1 Tax=Gloeomargarita lithophora Alchichica-D10 TaxID=1188229 RepID=A0A1J0ADV9_9CYAN|nr:tRNA lysidine(34) synthetase TilS [Gloeomargarita lithophora]APB34099.1 tRNA(Ile)-lysidine synthetase [Gloeomargarita lithophora Alchichica-D10]
MTVLRQVQAFLRQENVLPPQTRVLVAVSGGQDSRCLLDVLHRLQPRWDWTLGIAHCDHGWRTDSRENAHYIQNLAAQYGYPYHLAQAQNLPSQEAAARQWRYHILLKIALQYNYKIITTGHTASDRVETFLFNLWRGSGLAGLVALAPSRALKAGVGLVRPLWTVTRPQTAAYCQERGLTIWPDGTNENLDYRRNRIRRELLPYLRQHFNPQVERQLLQTLEIFTAEQQFWQGWRQGVWPQIYDPQQQRVNRQKLAPLPLALQRHVLRFFLQSHLQRAVNFQHIEQVRRLLTLGNGAQTAPLPGGQRALVRGDWLCLTPALPVPPNPTIPPPPGFDLDSPLG